MNEIRIEVFQADRGDCMLVTCEGETTTNILIDLGVKDTYKDFIKKRFEELKDRGENVDLIVFTHVDDDHIGGALPFLVDNCNPAVPNKLGISDVWLNSYRHLSFERVTDAINQRVKNSMIRQISIPVDDDKTNITAEDGTTLAGMLYRSRYPWNAAFEGKTVMAGSEPIFIGNEVKITVLTPTFEQLSNLQRIWIRELRRMFPEVELNDDEILDDAILYVTHLLEEEYIFDDAEPISKGALELIEGKFSEDTSVINASSITFILEYHNKRLLFLADSPPSTVLQQLKSLYPEMSPEKPVHFDAVKVSHHGSKRNTSSQLMKQISSERFIFSTCGAYGHPHTETVSRILFNSSYESHKKLYFNYETDTSRSLHRDDWMIKYNYSCHIVKEPILIATDNTAIRGDNNGQ